jgi:hypothetical protein
MATVGELLVSLRASTEAFSKDLDKASQLAFNTSAQIQRSFQRIGSVIAVELTAAVGAISAAVVGAIEHADKMGILAHQAGLTADQFTALAYAARLSDVSAQSLSQGLVFLSRNLEKSNQATQEGQAAHSALSRLFAGSIPVFKNTNDAFLTIIDRLSRLKTPYEQVALASQIFGRGVGAAIVPMLESKEGMAALTAEAQKLGVVISDEVANKANQFDDTIIKLKDGLEGLALKIGIQLLPYLQNLADKLLDFQKNAASSQGTITALANSVKVLVTAVIGVGGAFSIAGASLAAFITIAKLLPKLSSPFPLSKEESAELAQALKNVKDAYRGTADLITNVWTPAIQKADAAIATHGKNTLVLGDDHVKLQEALKETIKGLNEEIIKLNFGEKALALYKLQILGATDAELAKVKALQQSVEMTKILNEQLGGLPGGLQKTVEASTKLDETWNQLHDAGMALFRDTRTPLEQFGQKQIEINQIVAQFPEFADAAKRALDAYAKSLGLVAVQVDKLKPIYAELKRAIADTFIAGIIHADNFGQALKRILDRLIEVIIQALILKPIFDWLAGKGGIWGSIFGGFLAEGGPAMAGQAYIVGEQGPEMFVPSSSGTIIPNDKLSGGGTTIYNIDARGAQAGVSNEIRRALRETEDRAVRRSVNANRELTLRSAT